VEAFLGLGSNLGDRLTNLQLAVDLLGSEPRIRVTRSSRVWETDPVGGPDQPEFLNAVIEVTTDLEPHDLLSACNRVEVELGRTREVRWGPRTIDIDILLIDALAIDDPTLTVPHSRLHQRAFALMPLLELTPDPKLPNGTRLLDAPPQGDAHPVAPPLIVPA
jgi:2-amino-4-hydroxy-6-hydroxymethyldihydropteridine diphosphokinase